MLVKLNELAVLLMQAWVGAIKLTIGLGLTTTV